MSFQDSMDRDVCKCGLMVCLVDCPHYDTGDKEFHPELVPMVELSDKIEAQIHIYKTKLKPGKERNKFRHEVSELITIYNRRSLALNKIAPYKTIWW